MHCAIPTLPGRGVFQAEVRGKVDDGGRKSGIALNVAGGAAMGQGKDEQVAGLQLVWLDELQLGNAAQGGVHVMQRAPCLAAAADLNNFHVRVEEQQAQQLAARVAAAADNADANHAGTWSCDRA